MPRHSENVEPSYADREDEQHVDPTQQHRIDREEVTRQHRARLSTAELPPRWTFATRSRIKPGLTQDVPHGRRSHPIAKPDEFAVDPAVTPPRVLLGEPDHQVAYDDRGTRATPGWFRPRQVGPVTRDQLPVPAQQRLRSHDPRPQHLARQHPGTRRQNQPVLRLQPRAGHLPPQHRHLMPQHQQLDVLRRLAATGPPPQRAALERPRTEQRTAPE
jgi:hypothetical protein